MVLTRLAISWRSVFLNSERILKIGQDLTKLSSQYRVARFFETQYIIRQKCDAWSFPSPRARNATHLISDCNAFAIAAVVNSGVATYGAPEHVPSSTSNNFIFSSLRSKSDSQLSKYCVVCEVSWYRCQQTAILIITALVTKILVIEQLLQPALKSTVSASSRNKSW